MRIVSYNIQATINASSYFSYSYQWPRQFLPSRGKNATRERIAHFLKQFDVACLQEIDLGGLRNGFKSHVDQFSELTGLKYHCSQTNRRLGKLSLHGNMILSKTPLNLILDSPLPGKISGRGVIAAEIDGIVIANAHLSLGIEDQLKQLAFIDDQLKDHPNIVLCGDFNTTPLDKPLRALNEMGWHWCRDDTPTFPSWKPQKNLDHILVKGNITATAQVSDFDQSDHLPVIAEIQTLQ